MKRLVLGGSEATHYQNDRGVSYMGFGIWLPGVKNNLEWMDILQSMSVQEKESERKKETGKLMTQNEIYWQNT